MNMLPSWLSDALRTHPVEALCQAVEIAEDAPRHPRGGSIVQGIRLIAPIVGAPVHWLPGREHARRLQVQPGSILAVASACPLAGESGDEVMFNTVFSQEHTRFARWHRAEAGAMRVHLASARVWPQARSLFGLLLRQRHRPVDDPLRVTLGRALLHLGRQALEDEAPRDPGLACFQAAVAMIEDLLPAELSRAQLAAGLGVHPAHLSRVFSRHGEESLSNFIVRRRIELALHYACMDPQAGLALAAQAAGFSSPSYFSQCCQRLQGCSPGRLLAERLADRLADQPSR